MKKLMFALIAGVAVSAAQAGDVFADGEGFEGAALGTAATSLSKFAYAPSSQSQDESMVTNGSPYTTGTFEHALFFKTNGVPNSQYLSLSTDGGTLYRSINAPQNEAVIGEEVDVDESYFIDTLVQFTVCDAEPEIAENAKLAIWLQASDDETTTNLMVKAKLWTVSAMGLSAGFATDSNTTNLVLSGSYEAGQWYRLTVEAVNNIFDSGAYAPGFKIRINGQAVYATNGGSFVLAGEGDLDTLLGNFSGNVSALKGGSAALPGGQVFASMAVTTVVNENYTTPTIAAVGFSGTGLVDEILFTDYDPDDEPVSTFDFTITFATNAVTSVSYAFNGSSGVSNGTVNATTTLTALPANTVVTLSRLTGAGVSGWDVQEAAITGFNNCTVDANAVTLDGEPGAASVTVGLANKTLDDDDVASALTALGITQPALVSYINGSAANLTTLKAWAGAYGYKVERVNNYPYAVDRLTNNLAIATSLFVTVPVDVTNTELGGALVVTPDAGHVPPAEELVGDAVAVVYPDGETPGSIVVQIDAGYGATVSGLTFAQDRQLQTDASSGDWTLVDATVDAESLAATSVRFVTSEMTSLGATAVIATMSAAAPTYDFTVTFGENISSVSYTINGSGGGTLNASGTIPGGLEADDVLVLTPASSLALPMFYTNSVAPVYASTFSWTCDGAAGAVTLYAADASSASGEAAEAAATNAVAEAAANAGADGAAVAANVDAAAKSEGVNVAKVASWLETKVAAAKVSYADVAAADSDDVAAAVGFDLDTLVADPKVEITAVEETTVEDADAYTLSFQVKDGQDPVAVGDYVANYVKSLVKMSSSLESWSELEKTVTVQKVGGVMKATVKPASPQTSAFMKIGE